MTHIETLMRLAEARADDLKRAARREELLRAARDSRPLRVESPGERIPRRGRRKPRLL